MAVSKVTVDLIKGPLLIFVQYRVKNYRYMARVIKLATLNHLPVPIQQHQLLINSKSWSQANIQIPSRESL